jgi:hypothetical protein
MVQEIVIESWCDPHLKDGTKVRGETWRVTITNSAGTVEREVDVCVDHGLSLLNALTLLDEFGRPITKPPGKAASSSGVGRAPIDPSDRNRVHCLACPEWFAHSTAGVLNHLKTVHGINDTETMIGKTCPMCGKECASVTGLASHSKLHPDISGQQYNTLTRMFWLCLTQGVDPHGIIAARVPEWASWPHARIKVGDYADLMAHPAVDPDAPMLNVVVERNQPLPRHPGGRPRKPAASGKAQ